MQTVRVMDFFLLLFQAWLERMRSAQDTLLLDSFRIHN